MRTFCITIPELEGEEAKAKAHFDSVGLSVEFIHGIHGVKSGIVTALPYEFDNPGSNFNVGPKIISLALNHYMVWTACMVCPEHWFLILESDAKFEPDWKDRLNQALSDVPADWDMIYVGSCNCAGKKFQHVAGEVYRVNTSDIHQTPQCTHAILYTKRAIKACLETQRRFYVGVDLALIFHTLPLLKTYVILPRISSQHNPDVLP